MDAAPDLVAALAALQAVRPRFSTASDDELLADLATTEAIGRLVDGLRIAGAAQVELRSAKVLGDDSLAFRSGARDAVELVAKVARIGDRAARQRIGIGCALAPRVTLQGDLLPGTYDLVESAVMAGEVGLDSARIIVDALHTVRPRVALDDLATMEATLVEVARTEPTDTVRIHAEVWSNRLDPDGSGPGGVLRHRRRAFRLGRTGADGMTRFSGLLLPEDLADVKELLQSRRRGGVLFRTTAGGDDACDTIEPEWREAEGARRSKHQQDYDTLIEALRAAVRAEHDGTASTATTHEVLIVAKASDLERRKGVGWTPGVLAGLPMPTVERISCGGSMRLLITGEKGEPLHLGRKQRVFTTGQKKALIARYGGCAVPGCTVPHPYVEAHHARWWERDGGRTDIDNGVLVCVYHHHLLHSPDAPIQIVRYRGDLFVVPSGWVGPPEERHRVQRHPLGDVNDDPPPPAMPNPWAA